MLRQPTGPSVVVGEPVEVVLQGVEARRRQDADLPHTAAQPLPPPVRALHRLRRPRQRRADRRAQTFRERDHDRIRRRRELRRRQAGRRRRVPQPRPVQVQRDPVLVRQLPQPLQHLQRHHLAARHVVRVLGADQRRAHQVRVLRPHEGPRQLRRQHPVLRRHRPQLHARPRRRPGELVMQHVSVRLAQRLAARQRVQQDRCLVRLRAAGEEERSLLAQQLRQPLLQSLHRRVVAQHVVTDLGLGDRLTHARRRARDRIAAQVDDVVRCHRSRLRV